MGVVQSINTASRKVPAWSLYVVGLLPPLFLVWQLFNGQLGVDPVKTLEHQLGEWALWLLIAGLAITPLRNQFGINLIKFRRALGLVAFLYVGLHLAVWLFLDMGLLLDQILRDIVKRWYITIGMASFVLMIPLAITSNNASLRKLGGATWRKLHKLVYGAVLLGGLHFVILVKGWQVEPLLYLALIIFLLALRLPKARKLKLV